MEGLKLLLSLAFVCIVSSSFGQDWAKSRVDGSPRHLEWVDVRHGDRVVKTFVAYPEKSGNTPVVILIHEIFGMTDWVQSMADQLAEAGYIAVAPDLLSGMAPGGGRSSDFADVGAAREAVSGLNPDQVTEDLRAVAAYTKTIPSSNGKLYVAGFCWGGTQSFRFATNQTGLTGAMVFYGTAPSDPAELARIDSPIYGFYGGNDNRVNSTLPDTEKMMKEAGKAFEPVIYDGAGHGFMRAGEMPEAQTPNVEGRAAAWKRWLEILSRA